MSSIRPALRSPTPRRTWAWLVLPYLEQGVLAHVINFSLATNDPSNTTVNCTRVKVYECPSEPNAGILEGGTTRARRMGNYAVNWGNSCWGQDMKNNPFVGPFPSTTNGTVAFEGAPFSQDRSFGVQSMTDGTSNTLLVAEVIAGLNSPSGDDHRRARCQPLSLGLLEAPGARPGSTPSPRLRPTSGKENCGFPSAGTKVPV